MKSMDLQRHKRKRQCTTIKYDVLDVEVSIGIQRIGGVGESLLLAVYFTQCWIAFDDVY